MGSIKNIESLLSPIGVFARIVYVNQTVSIVTELSEVCSSVSDVSCGTFVESVDGKISIEIPLLAAI